jgi:hypothetical protein
MPIPTGQRLDVFVCPGVSQEALDRWVTQGGKTTFHTDECSGNIADWGVDMAKKCGIALFTIWSQRGVRDGYLDGKTSELLQPFYDRAGEEANCFQWQPIEKNFVRRGPDWFNERKTA